MHFTSNSHITLNRNPPALHRSILLRTQHYNITQNPKPQPNPTQPNPTMCCNKNRSSRCSRRRAARDQATTVQPTTSAQPMYQTQYQTRTVDDTPPPYTDERGYAVNVKVDEKTPIFNTEAGKTQTQRPRGLRGLFAGFASKV